MLKNGTEEQLAALLPKMPNETWPDQSGPWAKEADRIRQEAGLELLIDVAAALNATPEQRAAAWMAWATQPRPETPPLPDAAFDRGNLYEDPL